MASGVVHISVEEAARDFAAVLRHVESGDQVVIEQDERPVAVVNAPSDPLRMGADFADDLEAIIQRRSADTLRNPWPD